MTLFQTDVSQDSQKEGFFFDAAVGTEGDKKCVSIMSQLTIKQRRSCWNNQKKNTKIPTKAEDDVELKEIGREGRTGVPLCVAVVCTGADPVSILSLKLS